MPDTAPLVHSMKAFVPAAGAAVAQDEAIGKAPFAGVITRASIVPEAALVADNVNNRSIRVVNKGQAGAGAVVAASYQSNVAGGNLVAFDEKDLVLGVAANLVVAKDDVLAADEIVAGAGVAHQGYTIVVEITRS